MARFGASATTAVAACFILTLYVEGSAVLGFTAFLQPIVREFAWSYAQVSLAASLLDLVIGLMAPVVGFMVDRWGSGRWVLGGSLLGGVGFAFLSLTSSLITFYAGFTLVAIGVATCGTTVLLTALASWFDRDFGKATGFVMSGFAAGGLMVPIIAGLINLGGWRTTFLLVGLGWWLIGLPVAVMLHPGARRLDHDRLARVPPAGTRHSHPPAEAAGARRFDLRGAVTSRAFWQLVAASALQSLVTSAVVVHVLPYLTTVGVALTTATFAAGLLPVVSIPGRLGMGWLGDILATRTVLTGGLAMAALGLLVLADPTIPLALWLSLVIYSTGSGGATTLRRSLIKEYFGPARFGRINGLLTAGVMMGSSAGPVLAGWTFDTTQSYRSIWIVFAAVLVAAAVLAGTMPSHRPARQGEAQRSGGQVST